MFKIIIGSILCSVVTISSNLIYLVTSNPPFLRWYEHHLRKAPMPTSLASLPTLTCHIFLVTMCTPTAFIALCCNFFHFSLRPLKRTKYMVGACQVGENFFSSQKFIYIWISFKVVIVADEKHANQEAA